MVGTAVLRGGRRSGVDEVVARWHGLLAWLVVPAVALFVRLQPDRVKVAAAALAAAGIVAAAARRPDLAILSLVVGLPFQLVLLSWLYARGAPAELVRPMGLWKEAVVVGIALAAVQAWRAAGDRPDAIDWAAGGYVAVVALYYAVPTAFVASDGTLGPPTERATLNVALRTATLFVVLLVAVRHLPLPPGFRDRFARTVFAVGVVVAAIAPVEMLASDRWNQLMVTTFQVPRYKLDILHITTHTPLNVRVYGVVGGTQIVRAGSVFLDQQLGSWLVPPFAIGLHRLLRGGRAVALGLAIIGLALIGTQTRAALLAAVLAGALLLRPHRGVDRAARARVGALLLAGALAMAPIAIGTGLVQRTVGGSSGDDGSTRLHLERSGAALTTFFDHPFGRGLGTGAGTAVRFEVRSGMPAENGYLQVANETGVVSIAFFVVLAAVVARRLGSHRDDGDMLAAAWRAVFVGLSAASMLHYVWENLAVAWTVWMGVGLILCSTCAPRPDPPRPRPGFGAVAPRDEVTVP